MSSAASSAAPAMLQRGHSSSRRNPSYNSAAAGQRTAGTSSSRPSATSGSHTRSSSQNYHNDTSASGQPGPPLENILPRRDYETSNVARTPSSRQSSSRDRGNPTTRQHARTDSSRNGPHRSSSRSNQTSHTSDPSTTPTVTTNGAPNSLHAPSSGAEHGDRRPTSSGPTFRKRTTIEGQSGVWTLGKTIGAGSMGKVKLAKKADHSGEQVWSKSL